MLLLQKIYLICANRGSPDKLLHKKSFRDMDDLPIDRIQV